MNSYRFVSFAVETKAKLKVRTPRNRTTTSTKKNGCILSAYRSERTATTAATEGERARELQGRSTTKTGVLCLSHHFAAVFLSSMLCWTISIRSFTHTHGLFLLPHRDWQRVRYTSPLLSTLMIRTLCVGMMNFRCNMHAHACTPTHAPSFGGRCPQSSTPVTLHDTLTHDTRQEPHNIIEHMTFYLQLFPECHQRLCEQRRWHLAGGLQKNRRNFHRLYSYRCRLSIISVTVSDRNDTTTDT